MKKRGKIIAVILALLMLLTGCSAVSSSEPVTIRIWHVYGAQTNSPLNDLIGRFNETVGAEKGIQVEVTMVSNNKNIHEDILAAANKDPGAPQLPDLFVAYPSTVMAMPDDSVLVDYRDYFTQEQLDQFIPSFIEDGEVNGRLVCLPVAKSTELTFVNKTAFDRFAKAVGANIEDLSTWEGIFALSKQYTEWTDSLTPEDPDDGKPFFVHDFHFNLFQVGVESLGESFFAGEKIRTDSPAFNKIWSIYADACLSGGVWLYDGYATEPLRTGESIVSVASSASVLYYSNEVIYPDNTSEKVELIVLPPPVFAEGEKLVMQRGAGFCTVKSTPEREKAAVTFLQWLTEPQVNTEFAVSTGYMPVTRQAFDEHLFEAVQGLTEQKYIELYKAYLDTQSSFRFYSAPKLDSYLKTETAFEEQIRYQMRSAQADNHGQLSDEQTKQAAAAETLERFRQSLR